jgi:TatD DNase family protein
MEFPTLDAHSHIAPRRSSKDLESSGAVLAMSLSLDEAAFVVDRKEPNIVWGAGCHPRFPQSQNTFDVKRFENLLEKTAIAGEIGLDTGSRVPLELQLENFRRVLDVVSKHPRLVSIHSYRATRLVLKELRQRPIAIPVLHWWTGSADETSEAVELGCYFSIHSAVARQSKFRTRVPLERILVESDHGYADPPAAIPCRIEWVEYLVAQQFKVEVKEIREIAWRNLAEIVKKTGTWNLLPESFAPVLFELGVSNRESISPILNPTPAPNA